MVYLQASRRCLKPQYCCTTTTSTLRKKFSYAGSRSTKTSYSTSPMSCSSCELHMIPTHFFSIPIFLSRTHCIGQYVKKMNKISAKICHFYQWHYACSIRVIHEYYPFHSTPTFFSEAHKSSVSSVSSISSLGWHFFSEILGKVVGEKQGAAGTRMSLSIPFSYLIFFGLPLETGSLTPIHTLLNI